MINITQGDQANLQLTATDGMGNPIDLTGASFVSLLRGSNGATISYANSQHTANPDQVNFKGQYLLALSPSDTNNIPVGVNKELLTQITQGGNPIFYRGPNLVNVRAPIPVA